MQSLRHINIVFKKKKVLKFCYARTNLSTHITVTSTSDVNLTTNVI